MVSEENRMKTKLRHLPTWAVIAGMGLILPAMSLAAPINGDLSIGGSSASVAATFLNFVCSGNPGLPNPCPADYGNFVVTEPTDGSFDPYSGSSGFIHSLNQTIAPLNAPFTLTDFLVFTTDLGADNITLDLTDILLGTQSSAACFAAPAAGQNCTPIIPMLGTSPFNLQNTSVFTNPDGTIRGTSTASFTVSGIARRQSGETSPFVGIFTAQFAQVYQSYLPIIAAGGAVTNAYSATFSATFVDTPIPEPGTTALMLSGLLLVASAGLRKYNRSRKSI
jgi:hypothetical protein